MLLKLSKIQGLSQMLCLISFITFASAVLCVRHFGIIIVSFCKKLFSHCSSPPMSLNGELVQPTSCNINGYPGEANANYPCLTKQVKVQVGLLEPTFSSVRHDTALCRLSVMPQKDLLVLTQSTRVAHSCRDDRLQQLKALHCVCHSLCVCVCIRKKSVDQIKEVSEFGAKPPFTGHQHSCT